jgi:photosystem II stability/assembly factor-like uncharacterized protein
MSIMRAILCAAACGYAALANAGVGEWTNVGIPGAHVWNVEYVRDGVAIAVTSGGIYRTTNHGSSWTLSRRMAPVNNFSIAVNPANPDQILVTGEGAYRSGDRGLTFTRINVEVPVASMPAVASVTFSHDGFYAWLIESDGDVRRSTDGGVTWQSFPAVLPPGEYWFADADVADRNTVYAGKGLGIYVSRDGGATWTQLPANNNFHPQASRTTTGRLIAIQTNTSYVTGWSNDFGNTWNPSAILPSFFGLKSASDSRAFAVDHEANFYSSADDGSTWTNRGRLPNGYGRGISVDPANAQRLLMGTYAGIIRSEDGGNTWTESNVGLPEGTGLGIVTTANGSTAVYVSTSDLASVYRRDAAGAYSAVARASSPLVGYPGMQTYQIAVAPQNPNTLYMLRSERLARSTNGGTDWTLLATLPSIYSLTLDPGSPLVLYATGQDRRLKSVDGGVSWTPFGDSLPASVRSALGKIHVDPANSANLFALVHGYSGASSPVYRSTDAGATWTATNWSDNTLPSPFSPNVMAFEPGRSSTIYLGMEFGSYKSVDSGLNWTRMPRPGGGRSVLVDPQSPQIVYATLGSANLQRSVDGGATWTDALDLAASVASFPGFDQVALVPGHNAKLVGIRNDGGVYEIDVAPRLVLGLNPATITAGTLGSFELNVTNPGVMAATRVRVTATLPPSAGNYGVVANLGSCNVNLNQLSCDIGTLAPAASTSITVTFTATGPGVTTFNLSAYETLSPTGLNSRSLSVEAPSSSLSGGGDDGSGGGGRLDYLLLCFLTLTALSRRRFDG